MKNKLTSAETKALVGELIGKKIKITNSPRPELIGVQGTVLDESMKTLTVDIGKKNIIITKSHNEFEVESVKVQGSMLECRPHDRLKKYWRKM